MHEYLILVALLAAGGIAGFAGDFLDRLAGRMHDAARRVAQ